MALFSTSPEFIAVILAATNGTRMFPLTTNMDNNNDSEIDDDSDQSVEQKNTSDKIYRKHLLPVGGIPIIQHLINTLESSGFEECHVILHHTDIDDTKSCVQTNKLKLQYYTLSQDECNDCNGSADALRYLLPTLPKYSNVVILPADIMLKFKDDNNVLGQLCDLHRKNENGCTMLLENSGDEGDDGLPLKESAKVNF